MKTIHVDYEQCCNLRDDSSLQVTGITYINAEKHPDWSFPLHSHEDALELSLILNGRGNIYYAGKVSEIRKRDLVIKNASVLHSEKTSREEPVEQICMSMTGVCKHGYPGNALLPDKLCPVIPTGRWFEYIRAAFLQIMKMCEERPTGYEAALHDICRALLSVIELLIPEKEKENDGSAKFPVIRNVVEYLNQHYMENISLENLARRFYFSPYYLARKFKDETGYTINQYVINRRMGEAERMLIYEKCSIGDIAKKTGYTNLQYFYKTFKKYSGCTPNEFKQLYKQEENRTV